MTSVNIQYQHLPGPVGECLKPSALASSATVPVSSTTSLIVTTGHIGLNVQTGELVNDTIEHEFEAIFDCLNAVFKNAGARNGLYQAYKFVSYLVNPNDESIMFEIFKRRWPGHTPTWATVIVKSMNVPVMHAEIVAEGVISNATD